MYAAPFEYHAPTSVAAAVALLEKLGDEAKLISGSQSLVPLMKLRLSTPRHLIDLRKVPGLATIGESSGALVIGAMATHQAVGERGAILRTSDGGASWEVRASGTDLSLHGLTFLDAAEGWMAGEGGLIWHTTDGGEKWAPQVSNTRSWLETITFVDRQHGWAAGEAGTILHTADGGATWGAQESGTQRRLYALAFADARRGWAVGEEGLILHTADGGENWVVQISGVPSFQEGLTARTTIHKIGFHGRRPDSIGCDWLRRIRAVCAPAIHSGARRYACRDGRDPPARGAGCGGPVRGRERRRSR